MLFLQEKIIFKNTSKNRQNLQNRSPNILVTHPNTGIARTQYYGFQGQEKDDEVSGKGNSYTAEFWQYDSRLGRRWNLDPKPNPAISSYACFANNPIMYSDPFGDTIRIDPSISQNEDLSNAYERWAKTKAGRNFYQKFEVGGKFEHISIVFEAKKLDATGTDGHGVCKTLIMSENGEESKVNKPIQINPEGKNLVAGKSKSHYLKFIITLDTQDLKEDKSNFAKACMINTIMHEVQHLEIDLEWLGRQNQTPGARQQHKIMYGGDYRQQRIDTFKEIEDLWLYDYENKWKTTRSKENYIIDKINTYDW